jgi:hypothetical protein
LVVADTLERVCRECGKEHAPVLVALLDLACTAARVGHLGRHTLVPPLDALLDLARVAEDYVLAHSARRDNSRSLSFAYRRAARLCPALC